MISSLFLLAIATLLLFVAGELTVRGATNLAHMLKMPPIVVGLLILSFGTSLPELFVSIEAALNQKHDLLVGNIIGSNIANTLLVLGFVAIAFSPMMDNRTTNINACIGFACAVIFFFLLQGGLLTRLEACLLMIIGIAFIALNFFYSSQQHAEIDETLSIVYSRRSLVIALVTLMLGFILLPLSADLLVKSASNIARALGIGEAIIGITIIAMGTSLPELTTSLIAAIRKENDLSIGNIIGSNIFNMLIIGGISGLVSPLFIDFASLLPHLVLMVLVMLIPVACILLKSPISKILGWSMCLFYAGYIAFLGQSVL